MTGPVPPQAPPPQNDAYVVATLYFTQDLQIVSGLMVASTSDRMPQGYHPVNNTLDDGAQAFKKKWLLVHYEAAQEAREAVTEILLLKSHKKEEIPEGFKQLP